MATTDLLPATIGRYRALRLIGRGAMGRVLLCHDPVLDRDVALKHLRNDLAITADQRGALVDRMRQEARASARVGHPNIIALHDMGEDPELGLFLVFEYVDGPTLKDRLTRGALGPLAAARLARELGDALSTAHQNGVVHRDIKPENIILARGGAKIADFGIARLPNSTLTRDGGLLGTPAYSAPESISSEHFSAFSDQFSLGATLYEAISGRRAFPGDDAVAVATRIATEEPPKIADICLVDPQVDRILARALAKNPRARYDSCAAFGSALAEVLEQNPRSNMPTVPDGYHRTVQPVEVPKRYGAIIGSALGGAALSLAILQLLSPGSPLAPQNGSSRVEVIPRSSQATVDSWSSDRGNDEWTPRPAQTPRVQKAQLRRKVQRPEQSAGQGMGDAGRPALANKPSTDAGTRR